LSTLQGIFLDFNSFSLVKILHLPRAREIPKKFQNRKASRSIVQEKPHKMVHKSRKTHPKEIEESEEENEEEHKEIPKNAQKRKATKSRKTHPKNESAEENEESEEENEEEFPDPPWGVADEDRVAYTRERPELLKSHPNWWVVYVEGERVSIKRDHIVAYQAAANKFRGKRLSVFKIGDEGSVVNQIKKKKVGKVSEKPRWLYRFKIDAATGQNTGTLSQPRYWHEIDTDSDITEIKQATANTIGEAVIPGYRVNGAASPRYAVTITIDGKQFDTLAAVDNEPVLGNDILRYHNINIRNKRPKKVSYPKTQRNTNL